MQTIEEDPVAKTNFLPKAIMFIVAALFIFVVGVQVFVFVEPWLFPLHMVQGNAKYVTANIIVGPYPHAAEFSRLKAQGVVEIVSLMSPSIPGENQLLKSERPAVKAARLRFTNNPMSFWPLRSKANKLVVDKLARRVLAEYGDGSKGKVYIHCYLGRHRVGLTEEAINSVLAAGKTHKKAVPVRATQPAKSKSDLLF